MGHLPLKSLPLATNTMFRGDNLRILEALPSVSVDLIYIDPPFFSKKVYKNIWGDKESVEDFEADGIRGFEDTSDYFEKHIHGEAKGLVAYLEWLRLRLVMCHRVLKSSGTFYLHLDNHAVHYAKVILDEIFGYRNFRAEIVWQRKIGKNSTKEQKSWPTNNDYILMYTKSSEYFFEPQYKDDSDNLPKSITDVYRHDENDGKGLFRIGPMEAPSDSPTLKFSFLDISAPKKGWRWTEDRMTRAYKEGILIVAKDRSTVYQKMYLSARKGAIIESTWNDIRCVQGKAKENQNWPTQKPLALLERIIKSSSRPGDYVLDAFAGCGTTMMAAHVLKRKWIGIDISPTAAKVNFERLSQAGAKINIVDEKDLHSRLKTKMVSLEQEKLRSAL